MTEQRTTTIKWNTEKPKFEDVEGKDVLVKWRSKLGHVNTDMLNGINRVQFVAWFDNDFIAYTILSEDEEVCEWVKSSHNLEVYDTSCGNLAMPHYDDFIVCPICTRRIHITSPKPTPLMGMEPEIVTSESSGQDGVWIEIRDATLKIHIRAWGRTHELALANWESLVKRLTK